MSEEESSIQEYFMTHKNFRNFIQRMSDNFRRPGPWIPVVVRTKADSIISR